MTDWRKRWKDRTRDGLEVLDVVELSRADCQGGIVVALVRQDGVSHWTLYRRDGTRGNHDLIPATKKVTKWVNVYCDSALRGFFFGRRPYDSEAAAKRDAGSYVEPSIGTFPIEMEVPNDAD